MENNTTTTQTALKWGLISGFISIVATLANNLFEVQIKGGTIQIVASIIQFVIVIIVLLFAMKDHKANNGGFMSYGQGLGIGSMVGAIAGVITAIFNYIYVTFVDNTMMERMTEIQIQKLEEQGMDSAQIDKTMEMMKMFTSPGLMFVTVVLTSLLFYFIVSLIMAAIQKNERPIF